MLKLVHIVGARPNFMKIAPLMRAVERENEKRPGAITQTLVHTGQHYDEAMSEAFFRDLDLPRPEINLEVGSGSHVAQLSRIMLAIEPVLLASRPDWVVVVGDVNSTLAGALVASKLGARVAHVEAGLRSFDRTMPEEINRLLTDQLSDLLLTPSADADANLLREGIDPARIARVGNVMIDSLHAQLDRARSSEILDLLGLAPREFAVVTLHRPANVDHPATLGPLLDALGAIAARLPVIFPAHPRTQARLREFNLDIAPGVRVIDPLGYRDFLGLWSRARLVLTDSGGLQEETTALGIACLTLRENTERPVTVEEGTNRVVGRNPERILRAALEALDRPPDRSPRIPELWDGHSAGRIVEALLNRTAKIKERQ
jgi:UDP-N-acetylglucosamine 2-epimerase (non-hydrolysing)